MILDELRKKMESLEAVLRNYTEAYGQAKKEYETSLREYRLENKMTPCCGIRVKITKKAIRSGVECNKCKRSYGVWEFLDNG